MYWQAARRSDSASGDRVPGRSAHVNRSVRSSSLLFRPYYNFMYNFYKLEELRRKFSIHSPP